MPQPEIVSPLKSYMPRLRDLAILWLICKKPCHGYEIIKKFREMAPPGLMVPGSRVYPGLNKLEKEGYLKSKLDTIVSQKRPRKVYTITQKGKDHLKKETEDVIPLVERINEFVKYLNKFVEQIQDDVEDVYNNHS